MSFFEKVFNILIILICLGTMYYFLLGLKSFDFMFGMLVGYAGFQAIHKAYRGHYFDPHLDDEPGVIVVDRSDER